MPTPNLIIEPEPGTDATTDTPPAVAAQATIPGALAMDGLALLGTVTSASRPVALLRTRRGGIERVTLGDSVGGARVAAITDGAVHVIRNGTATAIIMPQG